MTVAGEQGGFVPGSLQAGSQAAGRSVQEGLQQAFGRTRNHPRGVLVRAAPDGFGWHGARLARHPRERSSLRQASSARGRSAWPQARVVAISECSTHAIVEAGVWPHDFDERAAGMRLLRGVGEGVLLLWDRGLHSFEMVDGALARGSELLGRLPGTVKPGSARSDALRRHATGMGETVRVRAGAEARGAGVGALDTLHYRGRQPRGPPRRASPDHLAAWIPSAPEPRSWWWPTTRAGSSNWPWMR